MLFSISKPLRILLLPFRKLKAKVRRNHIIIAHMSQDEMRELKRKRDELGVERDRHRDILLRHTRLM